MANPSSHLWLVGVLWIASIFHYASACSLSECLNGTVLANAPPIDTTLNLTVSTNETCSNISLPLRCFGCSSCDSNFILEWPDSDSYNCSLDELYSRAPGSLGSISCSSLVFGNLTESDGHCGFDEASGRGICRYADSQLMGGTRVCRNYDAEATIVTETSLILRRAAYQCVPSSSTDEFSAPPPSDAAVSNDTVVSTVVQKMDNDTYFPSESPTLEILRSVTSSSPKTHMVSFTSLVLTFILSVPLF